jgi:hypothetical protein
MGFFNPIAQWITWFISGRRKRRPAGVRGCSVSFSSEAMGVAVWGFGTRRRVSGQCLSSEKTHTWSVCYFI